MKKLKRLAILAIVVLIVGGGGYYGYTRFIKGEKAEETGQQQVYEVKKGDLSTAISTTGSLTMPNKVVLRFSIGGSDRDVITEMNVKLGDSVEKEQVLAKLSPASAQKTLSQAEANLLAAQQALKDAKEPYTEADIAKQEASVLNAQVALSNAEEDLDEARNPYEPSDFADAEAAVRNAQVALENARRNLTITQNSSTVSKDVRDRENERNWYETNYGNKLVEYNEGRISKEELDSHWNNLMTAKERYESAVQQAAVTLSTAQNNVEKAEDTLRDAEKKLADMRKGTDPDEIARKQKQVPGAQANLQKEEEKLADMKAGPETNNVRQMEEKLKSAQATYEEAKEDLEGTTLIAPFDGLVADVGAKQGESVSGSTDIITLLDPTVIELEGALDEVDVYEVKVGQEATITLDAISGIQLGGKVTAISPSATVRSGVVTYGVLLSVEPPRRPQAGEGSSTSQEPGARTDQLEPGSTPEAGVERPQRPQTLEGSAAGQRQQAETTQTEAGTAPPQAIQLKEGLTATAEIVVVEKKDVLLVPTRAIQRAGRNIIVQVLADGKTSERIVRTGLSDDQNTEIISGLEEGEQIVMPTSTTTTRIPGVTGQGQMKPNGGFMIPH